MFGNIFELSSPYTGWFTEITVDNNIIYCLQWYFFWTTLYRVVQKNYFWDDRFLRLVQR